MECTNPYRSELQRVAALTKRLRSSSCPGKSRTRPKPNHTLPAISLPLPESITQYLLDLGWTSAAANSGSNTFIRSAQQIRDTYQSTYYQLGCEFATEPAYSPSRLDKTRLLLERRYHERIQSLKQMVIQQTQRTTQSLCTKSKPVFNQEFLPILETYFEYNAYPSALDRAALARKSMMTPRQIEVWFQNHRNRAKKDGKLLRRLDNVPLQLSLGSLSEKMPYIIIPEEQRKNPNEFRSWKLSPHPVVINSDDEIPDQPSGVIVPACCRPPHAFPTVYASSESSPFRTGKITYSFPPPVWARTPATSRPPSHVQSLPDFIKEFRTKLTIRESSSGKPHRQHSQSHSTKPWFFATCTITPPAPHPALVRQAMCTQIPHLQPILSLPQSDPTHRHPHPQSIERMTITMAASALDRVRVKRKVASLPRRIPQNQTLANWSVGPTESDTACMSPSFSTGSRALSFSSNPTSPPSRRSSTSSSSGSSEPSTPVDSPKCLPLDIDFQKLGGLNTTFNMSATSIHDKQSHNTFGITPILINPFES